MFTKEQLQQHQQVLREIEYMLKSAQTKPASISTDAQWAARKIFNLFKGI